MFLYFFFTGSTEEVGVLAGLGVVLGKSFFSSAALYPSGEVVTSSSSCENFLDQIYVEEITHSGPLKQTTSKGSTNLLGILIRRGNSIFYFLLKRYLNLEKLGW